MSVVSHVDKTGFAPSYLPAKAPRLHTRGREGRHVRYSAPCTPALAWSLARPTTLSVRTREKHTEIKAMITHANFWYFVRSVWGACHVVSSNKQQTGTPVP